MEFSSPLLSKKSFESQRGQVVAVDGFRDTHDSRGSTFVVPRGGASPTLTVIVVWRWRVGSATAASTGPLHIAVQSPFGQSPTRSLASHPPRRLDAQPQSRHASLTDLKPHRRSSGKSPRMQLAPLRSAARADQRLADKERQVARRPTIADGASADRGTGGGTLRKRSRLRSRRTGNQSHSTSISPTVPFGQGMHFGSVSQL